MKRNIEALEDGAWDVLILGGGITGAGVALDAVRRGYRVALIDKGDFASGTSSASSKLVHGGLRYLEHGEFHLVHEALRERGLLLMNAPHLVKPLRFLLPFYEGDRVPAWKWRLGLMLYDLLAGSRNIRRSKPLTVAQVRREVSGLKPGKLLGAAEYFDGQMDDARLCLEVVMTADQHGAIAANYVEAAGFEMRDGRIRGVRALDRITGKELTIHAQLVINAAGPWVDGLCGLAGDRGGPQLRATKGVHIIVRRRQNCPAFLFLHPEDGRVFFVLPWQDKTLIGTTDTFATEGPDELQVHDDDIAYLLRGFNHFFDPGVERADVLGSFAGLRPLLRGKPGQPSSLTREFRVFFSERGMLSVAGGKYTTYRAMAEAVVDAAAQVLGRRRPCTTRNLGLWGAPAESWPSFRACMLANLQRRYALAEESARHLLDRYGCRAEEVVCFLESTPGGREPICAGEPDLRGELAYQREHEMAMFPADHFLRRTRLGLFKRGLTDADASVL